jgi:hypothetical protein
MKTLTMILVLLTASVVWGQSLPEAPAPKFLNRETVTEISALTVLEAADAFTSVDLEGHGYREFNPIARPFMHSRIGTAAYFTGSTAIAIGEGWFCHRMAVRHPNHRKFWTVAEHVAFSANITLESLSVANNGWNMANLKRPQPTNNSPIPVPPHF